MKLKKVNINAATPLKPRGNVLIIYTGGTLGMVSNADGVLVPFDFSLILGHLPTLRKLALELTVVSFETPIDSSNIAPDHWKMIGQIIADNYSVCDGFVVLHGTDTMAYTASALSFMLEGLDKPVIFTGAQLPISEPRSDARENLITALEIASAKIDGRSIVPEVCIYFDYELLRGNRSRKVESLLFNAFESGNYPPLAKAGVKINYNLSDIRPHPNGPLKLHAGFDTNISILKLFPGIGEATVNSVLFAPGLKAVILETFGAGNAPTLPWLTDSLKRAINAGVLILNVSQCPGGMVLQGKYSTSQDLLNIGVVSGNDITTEAAITKLMVLLARCSAEEAKISMQRPLAGEMSF